MRRFQPALLGGLFIGVLSSLPFVSAANLCCCLWVILGGILTTYLQRQQEPAAQLNGSEAALQGLVAGAMGGVLYILAALLLFSISGDAMEAQFRAALDEPQIPPEVRDWLVPMMTGRNVVLFMGAVTLPVYAVFAMLGSLLGVAIFRRKTPPAASPQG